MNDTNNIRQKKICPQKDAKTKQTHEETASRLFAGLRGKKSSQFYLFRLCKVFFPLFILWEKEIVQEHRHTHTLITWKQANNRHLRAPHKPHKRERFYGAYVCNLGVPTISSKIYT